MTTARKSAWLCFTIAAIAASGCSTPTLSLRPEARSFTESDYENIYDTWTREADAFDFGNLSDVLNATATFQSWEFRWAYVVRYASDHALGTAERTEMLRATLADARRRHRFFVTMSGNKWRETDLTNEDSVWRVLLVDERGEQTVPVEIERLERPTANVSAYFPSVSVFRHAFRIVFPATRADGTPVIRPDARTVTLRFTGPVGRVDLVWELTPPGGSE